MVRHKSPGGLPPLCGAPPLRAVGCLLFLHFYVTSPCWLLIITAALFFPRLLRLVKQLSKTQLFLSDTRLKYLRFSFGKTPQGEIKNVSDPRAAAEWSRGQCFQGAGPRLCCASAVKAPSRTDTAAAELWVCVGHQCHLLTAPPQRQLHLTSDHARRRLRLDGAGPEAADAPPRPWDSSEITNTQHSGGSRSARV